ncbi:MAG: glycosyltransferase, partial [Gaiellaceae bacterium]
MALNAFVSVASFLVLVLAVAVVAFSARRFVFLVAALLPARRCARVDTDWPSLVLVVPARNEAQVLDEMIEALAQLRYPGDLLTVLVSDGSEDATAEGFARFASDRERTLVLDLATAVGKFQAINLAIDAALRVAPASRLIAVCDADLRPQPDCLARLVEPFTDPLVGATAGFLSPANATATPLARYAALESWVHQLVTSAAKDRLDLNPPTLGVSAYRREALEQVGWFRCGQAGEDVRITVALTRAGWHTRFVPQAVAENTVVSEWSEYWAQHVRWARNLLATAATPAAPAPTVAHPTATEPRRTPAPRLRAAMRLELWFLAAGYADRLAFAAILGLALVGWIG